MRRALVLGGGGVIGVAWESGLVAGLFEGGIDVRDVGVIVGTSAGSIVGTRLAAGHDPGDLLADQGERRGVGRGGAAPDLAALGRIFELWGGADEMTAERCREIGRLALEAKTLPDAQYVEMIGVSTRVDDWPDQPLRVTAVDVESGDLTVHERGSAPIHEAVASSCAVPGIFPPVGIGARRFMDGGVHSTTCAGLVLEDAPERVLVIAPMCGSTAAGVGRLADRQREAEVAALRAAGCRVCAITPEGEEVRAFGGNLMSPENARASAEAGYERGRDLAKSEVGEVWLG